MGDGGWGMGDGVVRMGDRVVRMGDGGCGLWVVGGGL